MKHDIAGRRTQPSAGASPPGRTSETRQVDREAPTPRLTGGAVWADHARLLLTKLGHLRTPQADALRRQARALAAAFDRWEPSAPNHEKPDQETRRAKLDDLLALSEQVTTFLGE